MHIILQSSNDAESRAVRKVSMLRDDVRVSNATIETLNDFVRELEGGAVPVGSVQFLRCAMDLIGVPEPACLSYPLGCDAYTHRRIWRSTADQAINMTGRRFIKSVEAKRVTGFVLDSDAGALGLSGHDQFQFHALCSLPSRAPVWVAEPVHWLSEHRFYVMGSAIVGSARYDLEEAEDVPAPDIDVVRRCIVDLAIPHPYGLDMGVLSTGQTALVEVNDGWSLGLYAGAMDPYTYVQFLAARWRGIALGKCEVQLKP